MNDCLILLGIRFISIYRVQVVTIVDGWAKLARGYGFVHCKNTSDLIKGKMKFSLSFFVSHIISTLTGQVHK